MGAAPEEDVDVHLASRDQERVRVGGRDDGMSMGEADAQLAVRHDLRQRQVGRVHVEVALDHLQVGRDGPEELIRLLVRQVAET